MSTDFERFTELVERQCVMSWRTAIGRDRESVLGSVNSVLFTRSDKDGRWSLTLQLRTGKRWNIATVEISPVSMSEVDVEPGEPGPSQRASMVAVKLTDDVAREVLKNWQS